MQKKLRVIEDACQAHGARATVEIEAVEQTIRVHQNGRTTEVKVERNNTIEFEIDHFVSRIENNDQPINSALTGVMNVAALEALKKSMQENRVAHVIGK
jgi:predicted dehydrogenase